MMRHEIVNQLIEGSIVAVLRLDDPEQLLRAAVAVRKGGITAIDVTMTSPNALQVIREVSHRFADDPDTIVGVGSVLDFGGFIHRRSGILRLKLSQQAVVKGRSAGGLTPTHDTRRCVHRRCWSSSLPGS